MYQVDLKFVCVYAALMESLCIVCGDLKVRVEHVQSWRRTCVEFRASRACAEHMHTSVCVELMWSLQGLYVSSCGVHGRFG